MSLHRLSLISIAACAAGLVMLLAVTVHSAQQMLEKQAAVREMLQLSERIDDFSSASDSLLLLGADPDLWNAYRTEADLLHEQLQRLGQHHPAARKAARRVRIMVESVGTALDTRGIDAETADQDRDIEPLEVPVRSRIIMQQVASEGVALDTALDAALNERQQTIAREATWLGAVLAGSALLFGALCVAAFGLIHRRIALPARTLGETLEKVRAGDVDARASVSGNDELSSLGRTLNTLLDERQAADLAVESALSELRATRDQLQRAQRVCNVGSWEFDFEHDRLQWSGQALEIMGVERESFGGSLEDFFQLVHDDDRHRLRRKRAEWLEQGGEFDAEYRIERPDGEVRWVHERAHIATDPETTAPSSAGTLQDVTDHRRQESQVRQFQRLIEGSDDLCGIIDDRYRYVWVNLAYAMWHAKPRAEIEGRPAVRILGKEYFENTVKPYIDQCLAGEPMRFETEREHPKLGTRRMLVRYSSIDAPDELRRHVAFVLTDITDIHAARVALRESRDALDGALKTRQALINSLPAHIALLDRDANIIDVNQQWRHFGEENQLGDTDAGVGRNYLALCEEATGECAEEAGAIAQGLRRVLAGERRVFGLEYPCHSPDQQRWFRVMFNRLMKDQSAPGGAVAMHVDITERKLAEQQLEKVAYEDSLTGLLSRNGFARQLRERLRDANWPATALVAMLDVVNLRDINDAYGYDAGDRLLVETGRRIQAVCGEQGLAARAGGDDFIAYLAPDPAESAEDMIARLGNIVEEPFELGGVTIEFEVAIGFTVIGTRRGQPGELVREAELALFERRSKIGAASQVLGYTAELGERTRKRVQLTEELRSALQAEEFELHFQPKVSLADGSLSSAEALLRWHHPERGLQPPGRFIPIAEQSQLIGPIGNWALRDACRQLRDWRAEGLDIVRVAVNVSLVQFMLGDFPAKVRAALEDFGVAPSGLSLEITESVFERHSDQLLSEMHELRELGVRLSLDDFGTGYSSLMHLHRYPFDEIKIDRSFVSRLLDDDYSRNIVRTVIDVAAALDADVVAEGIESPEIVDALVKMGVRIGQGFYYSMPLEAEDFRWLLQKRSNLPLTSPQNSD